MPPPHASQVVRCLLINPFPESALNEEAGKLFMEDYDSYFRKAQMMTEVHALAKKGEASGAAAGEGGEGSASEPVEKRQKQPADADKAAEKRRQDKKKSLKRCAAAKSGMPCHAAAAPPPHARSSQTGSALAHATQQAAGPAPVSLSLCRADAACAGCEYGVLFPGVVRCEPASAMRRAGESCRYRMNAWEGIKICLYRAGPAQALRLAEDGAPGSSKRSRSEARFARDDL